MVVAASVSDWRRHRLRALVAGQFVPPAVKAWLVVTVAGGCDWNSASKGAEKTETTDGFRQWGELLECGSG